jgi:hypothetical protein
LATDYHIATSDRDRYWNNSVARDRAFANHYVQRICDAGHSLRDEIVTDSARPSNIEFQHRAPRDASQAPLCAVIRTHAGRHDRNVTDLVLEAGRRMRAHTEFPTATTTWWTKWTRGTGADSFTAPDRVAVAWARQRDDGCATTEPFTEFWCRLLDDYLQGWAEADPIKIIRATATEYRFDDPLVGMFSRWSLPLYFMELRARFARSGASDPRDFAMIIDRPAEAPAGPGQMRCFREAPRLGLSGVSLITVGAHGVLAESVAYDANLALEVLRAARAPE